MPKLASALAAVSLLAGAIVSVPAAARAPQLRVVRADGTDAPSFVSGIDERPLANNPTQAAFAHLRFNRGRYNVDVNDLKMLEVIRGDATATVRFGQTYKGHEVFGAQYLVHLVEAEGGFAARSVNGHYFTDLDVQVTRVISVDNAREIAIGRTRAAIVDRVEQHGLIVLPTGRGVPAYHFTLWGRTWSGSQARQEVFVNSRTGSISLSFNNIHSDGPVVGEGTLAHVDGVLLNLYLRGSVYEMRDQARAMFATNGGQITTHDAEGAPFTTTPPTDANIVTREDLPFQGYDRRSGSVDAHWGAGQVYEFYRALGRNSLDNQGMSLVSLVNAGNADGGPLFNASWNGSYVTYGNPDPTQLYPFSAGLDVVGHEWTHAVTDFSGGLVNLSQSGAMNEAYSDYFGNAIELNVTGQPMDTPGAGFIGEDLCLDEDPDNFNCPIRTLNSSRSTEDYIFFLSDFDNGGIHINAPIFGSALWEIRERVGAETGDLLMYKTLTEFTTPLDTFIDGRNAVQAAATALGFHQAQNTAVRESFDKYGIVEGWDTGFASDALTLIPNHSPLGFEYSPPRVSGPLFVAGHYANLVDVCCAPEEIYVGRVDGTEPPQKVGQDEEPETLNDELPDISGKRVVWAHLTQDERGTNFDVNTRVLGKGVQSVAKGKGFQWYPAVDGDVVAWENFRSNKTDIWARELGTPAVRITSDNGDELRPDVSGDWIGYWDPPEGNGAFKIGIVNMRTGKSIKFSSGKEGFLGPPSLSGKYVYWYEDKGFDFQDDGKGSIVRARLGEKEVTTLVRETSGLAPYWGGVTSLPVVSGNDHWVAYSDEYGYLARIRNPSSFPASLTGRDVWIVDVKGGKPKRVTCNRGDQAYPAIGNGQSLVWMDTALGRTDLVSRSSPVGTCV
jgi:beta propeller repeat protein